MASIKTGVELELWVVDEAGRLCDGTAVVDAHDRIEPEFIDPLVEVQTEPRETEAGLRRDLQETLRAGLRAAEATDRHLVPLGTPLTRCDAPANCERGRLFETIYGDGITSAKNCAGTHVHFEKGDVGDQLNLLTALDPALALVSSSPYYLGERGDDSARARAYRRGCGPGFRRFCDLWSYADGVSEWRDRVDQMYECFENRASDQGVSAATVDAHFTPHDAVLNPVRLRDCQPTVEWRAPDATLPSEVARIAADVGDLVSQLGEKSLAFGSPGVETDRVRVPPFEELRELSRTAISSGLGAREVRAYLRALGFDLSRYDPLSSRMRGRQSLREPEARILRLEQARRLRADVESLTDDHDGRVATAPR